MWEIKNSLLDDEEGKTKLRSRWECWTRQKKAFSGADHVAVQTGQKENQTVLQTGTGRTAAKRQEFSLRVHLRHLER